MSVYEKMDRVTVAEAAIRLGVKEQAIRKRIHRGTLAHDKDDDGRVHVYLAPDDRATGTDADAGINTLLQSLQDQIVYLRQESEDWKEEARRKDTIIMSLTQHIPELEVSSETREAPVGSADDRTTGTAGPQKPLQRRSWWREFFGLG